MIAPHRLPFPVSISCTRRHWSSTAATFLPLTAHLPSPYGPIKGTMRAPLLSFTPPWLQSLLTLKIISPSEHHLLPLLSVVMWPSPQLHLQVVPLVRTPTTSSLSLSLSYHDDLSSLGAATPPHGRESTMNREPSVVPWSIDPIHNFFYIKTILRNPRKCQNHMKTLRIFNKSRNSSYLFQISLWTLS
jgi:hypothetical protein